MRDLSSSFEALNDEQKKAVRNPGNTVVLAGPGSGKTATLVVKVAHLLKAVVQAPQGVACITFNNDAVDEFRRRLAEHGLYAGRRLYLGSVHSFCLNCIVRPYGRLVDKDLGKELRVISERAASQLLERIAESKIANLYMPSFGPRATKMRRAIACGENIGGFDDQELEAVREYERTLGRGGVVDFEAMVLRSVALVERHEWIRRLLVARFPFLVVDEYQDLGGPLHRIVTTLVDSAGAKVFAVGDPDQTVYDFTGASPKYLAELEERDDFTSIRLRFNYRSGGDLINAGQAALALEAGPRDYAPDPSRKDRGQVLFKIAADSLVSHAEVAVDAVREALASGTAGHEIAVLYRQKTELLPELKEALDKASIPYTAERERTYAKSQIVRWLQQVAGWAVSAPAHRETLFGSLLRFYGALLSDAGVGERDIIGLPHRAAFHALLRQTDGDELLGDWLRKCDASLGLRRVLRASRSRAEDDIEDLEQLLASASTGEFKTHTVRDFAEDGRTLGRVVLTTLHGSKGRQFDVIVMPGLVEGVSPKWTWNRRERAWQEPDAATLRQTRRLFYVGFTRARHVVHLIVSNGFVHKGYLNKWGPSRFAREIQDRLKKGR